MRITYEFHKDNPPKKCPEGRFIRPGGSLFTKMLQGLYECPVSAEVIDDAIDWEQDKMYGAYPKRPNHLTYLALECAKCALKCAVAVEVDGKIPTGNIKLTYSDNNNV